MESATRILWAIYAQRNSFLLSPSHPLSTQQDQTSQTPRLCSGFPLLLKYNVKITSSHLTSPLSPHYLLWRLLLWCSYYKDVLMMFLLWCYFPLMSVGDHIKKITCLKSWHVTLPFTWPEFLPPRDFIWFELSIKHLPNSLFGLFTLLLYLWVWKTYGNATH